jgi:LPXTG-site transpeptidase (sortase) family protein
MIAGFDYLILRGGVKRFWTRTRVVGAALLIAGGLLIGIGGAYYGYASNARADLDKFQVAAVEIAPVFVQKAPASEPAISAVSSIITENSLYSGDAGFDPSDSGPSLPEGFQLIDFSGEDPLSLVAPATQMSIPALEIDSVVSELSIQELGDRRAYQTPNNAVGHIQETSDAGENGQGWYFGHTESPILNEGSVFFDLQQVPEKLLAGEEIQIITDNGTEQFLYRVTGTRVVHEDELTLTRDGGPNIHLVSCVPRLVYDHRLIVDAELIAHNSTG